MGKGRFYLFPFVVYLLIKCSSVCCQNDLMNFFVALVNGDLGLVKIYAKKYSTDVFFNDYSCKKKFCDLLGNRKFIATSRPIHLVSFLGHLNILKYLVEDKKFNADTQDYCNERPIYYACSEGHHKIVGYLFKKGASVNEKTCNDETMLHVAVKEGHMKVVQVLIEAGANVNETSYECQETALYCAAREERFDIVKYLVKHGADINSKVKGADNLGYSYFYPIHWIVDKKKIELTRCFLAHGAKIDGFDWFKPPEGEDEFATLYDQKRQKSRKIFSYLEFVNVFDNSDNKLQCILDKVCCEDVSDEVYIAVSRALYVLSEREYVEFYKKLDEKISSKKLSKIMYEMPPKEYCKVAKILSEKEFRNNLLGRNEDGENSVIGDVVIKCLL